MTFAIGFTHTGSYTITIRATDNNSNNGANGVLFDEETFTLDVTT